MSPENTKKSTNNTKIIPNNSIKSPNLITYPEAVLRGSFVMFVFFKLFR